MPINWNMRKYSKDTFVQVWDKSPNVYQVVIGLGLCARGTSNYQTIKKTAEELGLPPKIPYTSEKKHRTTYKKSLSQILVENSNYNRSSLKKRLLEEGLLESRCYAPFCPNPVTTINGITGEEIPVPLTLDHINGVHNDNRLSNLRLLCPNCDRCTSTFSVGSYKTSDAISKKLLCSCGKNKSSRSIRCLECYSKLPNPRSGVYKIDWPDTEKLIESVEKIGYNATGRVLGVSGNTVKKRIKTHP